MMNININQRSHILMERFLSTFKWYLKSKYTTAIDAINPTEPEKSGMRGYIKIGMTYPIAMLVKEINRHLKKEDFRPLNRDRECNSIEPIIINRITYIMICAKYITICFLTTDVV
jgi:hypothetical protein